MKALHLVTLLLISSQIACTRLDIDQVDWTHEYQLSACADPWDWNSEDDLDSLEGIIQTYLEEQGINVRRIAVIESPEGAEACLACFCKSGYKVLIKLNERNEERLEALTLESYQQWTEIND